MPDNFLTDGVLDLSLGMNAGDLPQLLTRGEAAFILNGDIGNGFMQNRPAHNKVAITAPNQGIITSATTGYFYGATIYTSDQGVTSIMASIAGELFQFTPQYDSSGNALNAVVVSNQSAASGLVQDTSNLNDELPGNVAPPPGQHFLEQAERWIIWDDGVNLPLFWDGSATDQFGNPAPTIRRSLGQNVPAGTPPELPAGRMLSYGQGQVWMALPDGYSFLFGDPVGYSSGTAAFNLRDAVLKTSINQNLFGGGNFRVPTPTGKITSLTFTALLDATLGTGPLQVFTTGAVYGCTAPVVPVSQQTPGTTPLLTASLIGAGGSSPYNAPVNGDITFRADDGSIRSLFMARRDFDQWGNTPISYEVGPYINGDNQNLLPWGATIEFDNNELSLINPVQGSLGVYFQAMTSLSLNQVSGIQKSEAPAWNGIWSIGNVLWIGHGKFNNVDRCFAFLFNTNTNQIELHELLPRSSTITLDMANTPITMQFISGALFWTQQSGVEEFYKGGSRPGKSEFNLIQLEYAEVAAQQIVGKVSFLLEFRSIYDINWTTWYSWTVDNTSGKNGYKPRMPMGAPPRVANPATGRNTYTDYAFQIRITITGSCRYMGTRVYASLQSVPQFAPPYKDGQST